MGEKYVSLVALGKIFPTIILLAKNCVVTAENDSLKVWGMGYDGVWGIDPSPPGVNQSLRSNKYRSGYSERRSLPKEWNDERLFGSLASIAMK